MQNVLNHFYFPLDKDEKADGILPIIDEKEEEEESSTRRDPSRNGTNENKDDVSPCLVCPFAVAHDDIVYGTKTSRSSHLVRHRRRHLDGRNHQHNHNPPPPDDDEDHNITSRTKLMFEQQQEQKEEPKDEVYNNDKENARRHSFNNKSQHNDLSDMIYDSDMNSLEATTEEQWWTWRNSDVQEKANRRGRSSRRRRRIMSQLISNDTGTILAVASEQAGTVSILRGCDGRILATRQVVMAPAVEAAVESEETVITTATATIRLSFVVASSSLTIGNSTDNNNDNKIEDALLIETMAQPMAVQSQRKQQQKQEPQPLWILVSNICGSDLNANDEKVVAQAASRLQIQRVTTTNVLEYGQRLRQTVPFFYDEDDMVGSNNTGAAGINDERKNAKNDKDCEKQKRIRFLTVVQNQNNQGNEDEEPAEGLVLRLFNYNRQTHDLVHVPNQLLSSSSSLSLVPLASLLPHGTSLHSGFFLVPGAADTATHRSSSSGERTHTASPVMVCSAAGIQVNPSIVWFDPIELKPIQVYRLSTTAHANKDPTTSKNNVTTTKIANSRSVQVIALAPILDSCAERTSCVACAIQTLEGTARQKKKSSTCECSILVLRAMLAKDESSTPQVLFRIPLMETTTIPTTTRSSIISVNLSAVHHQEFALRASWLARHHLTKKNSKTASSSQATCTGQFDFVPNVQSTETMAQVQHLLSQNCLDEADQLVVAAAKKEKNGKFLDNPYSDFHSLDVPFRRLEALATTCCCSPQNAQEADSITTTTTTTTTPQYPHSAVTQRLNQIKECITRLAVDPRRLLVACDLLWNSLKFDHTNSTSTTIKDLHRVWSFVDLHLKRILSLDNESNDGQFVAPMQRKVQDRLGALQLVDRFCQPEETAVLPLEQVVSTDALVSLLIQQEFYDTVNRMWTVLGTASPPNANITEIQQQLQQQKERATSSRAIVVNVDALLLALCEHCGCTGKHVREPARYLGLLRDIVLPALAVNHPLIGLLRAWCCQTAYGLDDNGMLESAIHLLRVRSFSL